jgi:hypothetical protein
MTHDDIIKLTRAQGLPETEVSGVFRVNCDDLGRLLAYERECCALLCESIDEPNLQLRYEYRRGALNCADAIRARSKA